MEFYFNIFVSFTDKWIFVIAPNNVKILQFLYQLLPLSHN